MTAQPPTTLTLSKPPHAGTKAHPGGQWAILDAALGHFFTTALFGRGSGKSPTAFYLAMREMAEPRFAGVVYDFALCTPFNDGAQDAYRVWKRILAPLLSSHMGLNNGHDDTRRILHLAPCFGNAGAVLDFWGLEAYDNLRRYRKHRIVVDEGKDVFEEAIFSVLVPMTFGRKGKILVMGTPGRKARGAKWLRRVFKMGMDPDAYPGFISLTAPSYCNPFLTKQELQNYIDACADERAVREEIWAEILDAEGAVFSNLKSVFRVPVLKSFRLVQDAETGKVLWTPDAERPNLWVGEPPSEPTDTHEAAPYCAGLDLGVDDSTVLSGFNRVSRHQGFLLRLRGMTYTDQLPLIDAVLRVYRKPFVVYDRTGGHGATVTEALTLRYKDAVAGRTWSGDAKGSDIARAQMLCSDAPKPEGWGLLDVKWQRAEFEEYQVETETKSGIAKRPTYNAPAGFHDDSVAAACLASEMVALPYAARTKRPDAPTWHVGPNAEVTIPAAWLHQQRKRERREERMRRERD